MTADLCPHCFAPARDNGRPGCACAARAAAAAAAAGDSEDRIRDDREGIRGRDGRRDGMREDIREGSRDGFDDEIHDDPMGPRPYVTLEGEDRRKGPDLRDIRLFERMTTRGSAHEDRDAHDVDAEPGFGKAGREQAGRADGADGAAAGAGRGNRAAAAAGAAAVTQAFEPVTQPIDRIGSIEPARAGAEEPAPAGGGAAAGTGRHRKSRRGPVVAVLSGAAAVAVAGTLAFGTGLLGGDKKHDEADRTLSDPSSSAPDDDPSAKDDETPDKPSPSASSTAPTTMPSASKKESASPRPSRSPSTPKSKGPARTAIPPTPSATDATGSVSPSPTESPSPTGPPVLREGDSGAEVVELQKRLAQLLLYLGPSDGTYDDAVRNAVTSFQNTYGVEGDPKGVYGPNTRRALESRTDEP